MAAVLVGLAGAVLIRPDQRVPLVLVPALIASFILGRLDDLGRVGPGLKWCIQTAVLAGVLASLHSAGLFDLAEVGTRTALVAVILALVLQTALGIFDNMDGALSLVASGSLVLAASGGVPEPLQPAAIAGLGATLGFLIWNLPPARLFLGNAGSQPLGLLVSALVFCALSGAGAAGDAPGRAWVLLLPLSWPVFDLIFVSARRTRRGSAPWRGGRDHTTHLLARRLGSDRAVFVAILTVTSAAIAYGYLFLSARH